MANKRRRRRAISDETVEQFYHAAREYPSLADSELQERVKDLTSMEAGELIGRAVAKSLGETIADIREEGDPDETDGSAARGLNAQNDEENPQE